MTDIIEECARAAFQRDYDGQSSATGWNPIGWDAMTDDEKAPFILDMAAALMVLRKHLYINIDGLDAIKAAEERRK